MSVNKAKASDHGNNNKPRSLWLALNPSKRWSFSELEYLLLALVSAVPSFVIPMIAVGKADRSLAWQDRYWVKFPYYELVD